jgi:hypothetical protein
MYVFRDFLEWVVSKNCTAIWKGKEYGDDDFFDYEDTQSCRSTAQE